MAQYTTKRKYTKKPSTTLKKVVKKIKKETVAEVPASAAPVAETPVIKSFWQKAVDWIKGLAE